MEPQSTSEIEVANMAQKKKGLQVYLSYLKNEIKPKGRPKFLEWFKKSRTYFPKFYHDYHLTKK